MNTTQIGNLGEEKATEYLKRKGYTIIARNYRTNGGELDIVARKRGLLVFVEVKTRAYDAYGGPTGAVTKAKQRKMVRAATQFIKEQKPQFTDIRFDIICVLREVNIVHLCPAFRPERTTL